MKYVLAVDQGTSGSKALIFSQDGTIKAQAAVPVESLFLDGGLVEQRPEDIVSSVKRAVELAVSAFLETGAVLKDIVAAGISNQRESFVLWDKTGTALTNVIVWQCKRSVSVCARMKSEGLEAQIQEKSGLPLDPYFSGSKLYWLLENDTSLKERCRKGELYFGTIDTWLLFKLTDGKHYTTDYTNASRTLLMNLDSLDWDPELIGLFGAEGIRLPVIQASSCNFGASCFGGIFPEGLPICAMIGDSHAASFGEGCFYPGTVKATMGTGSSVLMNTGSSRVRSQHGLVSTICWSTADRVEYALEGVIVSCGSTVNWCINQLGLASNAKEFDRLAESVKTAGNVLFIPAFSGLGGPHWQMERRAEILGISFDTTAAHIIRAALESYPFQLKDVIRAMESDMGSRIISLKADGGMTVSRLSMRCIADLLETELSVDRCKEASAFGAALLALLGSGVLTFEDICGLVENGEHESYKPGSDENASHIKEKHARWLEVIGKG